MTVRELYEKLEERIPKELSMEWDNDGLMCSSDDQKEVKKILICLDVTAKIVEKAVFGGYDLILSHHPLIFHPLPAMEPGDFTAKKVITLLQNGISVMSFHTRLDAVRGGVNDTLADALGLRDVVPFGEGNVGRIGTLSQPTDFRNFAQKVKETLSVPAILGTDAGLPVFRVALLGGSGSDEVPAAKSAGADTYLSGEIAHHYLTDAPERGINLIAAGHYHTEQPVTKTLAEWVKKSLPQASVTVAESNPIELF